MRGNPDLPLPTRWPCLLSDWMYLPPESFSRKLEQPEELSIKQISFFNNNRINHNVINDNPDPKYFTLGKFKELLGIKEMKFVLSRGTDLVIIPDKESEIKQVSIEKTMYDYLNT